jgi:hypothetical protein
MWTLRATCDASRAAWFRDDARRCTVGANVYDPCFVTPMAPNSAGNVDPRKTDRGTYRDDRRSDRFAHPARWVRPSRVAFRIDRWLVLPADRWRGREFDGFAELYSCQFGSDGQADAVLGELDSSQAQWTIRKVLINKKTEPQTIKSLSIAAVKAVWQ